MLLTIAMRHISEVFRSQVVVLLPGAGGALVCADGGQFALDSNELGVGKWVHEHHQPAGLGTSTLPGAAALYLPLQAPRGPVGVLGIRPADRIRSMRLTSSTSSRRSPTRPRSPSSARSSPTRRSRLRCEWKPSGSGTRCSARSRTIENAARDDHQGIVYALLGSVVSAAVTYGFGRLLGRDVVRRLAGPRLNR